MPHRATRRLATSLSTAAAAATLAWAGLGGARPGAEPGVAAQSGLREAYRLVDTWDGAGVQSAQGAVLYPAGVDATAESVYVVDRGNDRIEVFTVQGVFVRAWGRRGDGPDELSDPRDVAVDGSRVYVADFGNGRVAVFDTAGAPVAVWDVPGGGGPWGVTARSGLVHVTVPEQGEVVALRDGAVVARWAAGGNPRGIDAGPDGRVYVADPTASEVRTYQPDGRLVATLAQPNASLAPQDVAVDDNGDLYVQSRRAILWYAAGESASRQALYRDDLQAVTLVPQRSVYATIASDVRAWHGVILWPWRPRDGNPSREWPYLGFPHGRFNGPHAVHAGAGGQVWVLDGWPRLQSFDPDGTPRDQRVPALTPQRLFEPVDLVAPASGELVVGEPTWLTRFRADGTVSNTLRLRRGTTSFWLTALAGLRADGTRVGLLDSNAVAARVYGVTRTVQPVDQWPLELDGAGWQLYYDLAAPMDDPAGRWYAVNRTARTIGVYEGGASVATWPVDGIPARAAVGPSGDLFVLTADGVVSKLAAEDGSMIAAWDAGAFSAGGSDVADLTVDAAGRVYTVDRAANTVRVWDVDPDATPEPPLVRRGACQVRGDKRAAPGSVQVRARVTVTLDIGGSCPSAKPGADIVLAIDRSFSMNDDNKITDTIRAAIGFVNAIDLVDDRIGVVGFNHDARLLQPLTGDRTGALNAVGNLVPLGGTNVAAAIEVAAAELGGPRARAGMQPVLVLLTDGKDDEPDAAIQAAAALKARGARIFTIAFGDIDPMVMVRAASSPEDAYYAPDSSQLDAIYAEIARRLTASVLARRLTLVDELPADMAYDGPVAGPPPVVAGRTLTWSLTDVPLAGLSLAYAVRPQQLGLRPTNVEAAAEFTDGLDRAGRLRFPVPEVNVLGLPPTATRTPTPFPTPTDRPTATPLPTDTPEPAAVFLPIVLNLRCEVEDVRADVAIVMDTSGSMREPARPEDPGRTRLAEAVDAAKKSVEILLALPGNRVAVVSFNEAAAVVHPLSSDRASLVAALDGLTTVQGTRIDYGIQRAAEALSDPSTPDNNRAMVLLTDGRATGVDNATVLATADAAKAAGIRIFTIGLGGAEDIDADLLRAVATRPDHYSHAPSAADLARIYERIAFTIQCARVGWP